MKRKKKSKRKKMDDVENEGRDQTQNKGRQTKRGTIAAKRIQQDKITEPEKEAEKREELVAEVEKQGMLGQNEEVEVQQEKEWEKEQEEKE